MAYTLSEIQEETFKRVANLYSEKAHKGPDGDVTQTVTLEAAKVPCDMMRRMHYGQEAMAGIMQSDIFGQYDVWEFPIDVEPIDDNWIIEDVTPGIRTQGQRWRVRGHPQVRDADVDDGARRVLVPAEQVTSFKGT